MAVDPKAALAVLGYDPEQFETDEAFRAQVETDWVKRDNAHEDKQINGRALAKLNGSLRSILSGIAKDQGIEGVDFSKIDPTDGIRELTKNLSQSISELKEAKAEGAPSKELEEMQKKVDALTKAKKDLETLNAETTKKYTDLETSVSREKSAAKVQAVYDRAYGKVQFKKDLSKYERAGFDQYVRENYVVQFDDEGKEMLVDKDGNQIKNPKKAGEFLGIDDALTAFAESEKLTEPKGAAVPERRTRQLVDEEQEERAERVPNPNTRGRQAPRLNR